MSVAILSAGLFFASCKKEKTTDINDNETELALQSDDQARFSAESDAADDDANLALESFGGTYAGARPISPLPRLCDADVTVDTTSTPRTITITYSGDTCPGARRVRTGSVVLTFTGGFRWAAAGSNFNITYNNLKVTRLADNKSIIINGNKTITNVTGGKLSNLASLGTVTHTVTSSGMSVTFDNGAQRTWKVARQRTFTYDNGVVISVTGIGPAALGTGVAEWGTNRFGRDFKSAILQPMVVKQSCDFRLVSGQVQHTGFFVTTTTTFGLDANGDPVTTCPSGPFYLKRVWVAANGQQRQYIGPY